VKIPQAIVIYRSVAYKEVYRRIVFQLLLKLRLRNGARKANRSNACRMSQQPETGDQTETETIA